MRPILLACLAGFFLAACGIKGPLYVPQPKPAPAAQPDSNKAPQPAKPAQP
jgi:predicted small lipoprotein YifL